MAQQDFIKQALSFFVENPQMLSGLMEHPYSTVRTATGKEDVSRDEVSQVVTAASALAGGQAVDFGSLASIASGLLSQNGGSAHALANALLGGSSAVSANNGVSNDVASNLAGVVFGGGGANNQDSIDLSDGFGLDDLAVLAKKFF